MDDAGSAFDAATAVTVSDGMLRQEAKKIEDLVSGT